MTMRLPPAASAMLLGALTSAFPASASLMAQAVTAVRRAEVEARTQLDSGKFGASRDAFASMLVLSRTRRDSAASIFGKAFAEQQTIASDSVAPAVAGRLVNEYRLAQRLDSVRYQAAAEFNIALLLASAGRHGESATAYLRVAQLDKTLRGASLLAAARELNQAGQRTRALSAARQAAADATVAAEAQALLVALHRDMRDPAALIALADTLQSPSAPLAKVNEALADMMQDRRWAGTPWAERCLILLARNVALLDVGPVHFTATQRGSLEQAAKVHANTPIGGAIRAFLEAYRLRDSTETYTGDSGPSWWTQRTPDDRRRTTWSRSLRGLGDWYNRAGVTRVAISFYESALGSPTFPVHEEWVDPEALPPLPALYATLPDTGAFWDRINRVESLTNALFEGKAVMRPGNHRRLRFIRLTLGSLFARQGRWDNAWHGAIYQLEETRRLTQRLALDSLGEAGHLPPDVYELLFAEYVKRTCTNEALSLGQDLHDEYARRGASADRDRIATEMARLRQSPVMGSRELCSGGRSVPAG